jgi:DNA-binding GntR family transcriptional regulator
MNSERLVAMAAEKKRSSELNTEKLSDQVYELLRKRITDGELRPGSRLRLARLVNELGISKTPLREALHKLELDQLVVSKPRSGTYVSVPSLEDIVEVCDLRKAIEWQAVQLAAPHMPSSLLTALRKEIAKAEKAAKGGNFEPFFRSDANLHRSIFDYCGNRRLVKAKEGIDTYVRWLRVLGATGVNRIEGASSRHRQIVDALSERDVGRVRDLMELHIEEVKVWTVEDLSGDGIVPHEVIVDVVGKAR